MKNLKDPSLLLVFAYAPAGLGHLRVLDALAGGLPTGVKSIVLGSEDKRIVVLHRFVSIHPVTRTIMEWFQQGILEDIFASGYRFYLRRRGGIIFQQLKQILLSRKIQAKRVLVVATHFGLAHQIASIKDKLTAQTGVKVYLVVQVTDDSSQHIWYVPGADLIFVPSQKTKDELILYGQTNHLPEVMFEVNSYPLSPVLTKEYSGDILAKKVNQLKFFEKQPINVSLPISGAAVGLEFSLELVKKLTSLSSRFRFFVVSRKTPYTQFFLKRISKYPTVKIYESSKDRQVVDAYEKNYKENLFALEITKPSEQAFKAILAPDKVGGVILLFSTPVGRQERDNLSFLREHQLLPSEATQVLLEKTILEGKETLELQGLREVVSRWRGLSLPTKPEAAAEFIFQSLKLGIFEQMMKFKFSHEQSIETKHDGVARLWELVDTIEK